MGGGASPLNTGGGMGGQNQTFGTMGGFGGNLGTAGTMGGQQNNVPQFAQNYLQQQQMGQQQQPNIASIFGNLTQQQQSPSPFNQSLPSSTTQAPQGYDSYGFDKNVVDYLNKQRQKSALDAGVAYQYDPQTQMFTGSTMGGQVRKSLADIQREASGAQQYQQPYSPRMSMDMPQGLQPLQGQFSYPGLQEPPPGMMAPRQAPQQQPDMSTAIGQLKGGDQFAAQNTMRQLVGLPPLQAPAYNANPTMSDVQKLMQSGDKASAQEMMQRMVGLPTSRPAPAIQAPPQQQPLGIQSLMQARPPRRRFGRM